jgi:hypothetical protein
MHNSHPPRMTNNHVTALFSDSAIWFSLSMGATFADLADRLEQLGERHTGVPVAIYLKVASPGPRFRPFNPDR